MNKKILVPILVTTLAASSISVNVNNNHSYYIVKAEEQLLTTNVDGMVIEKGILKRYEGNASQIVIPEGVISIGEYAFQYKDSITSVTIPESVTEIGKDAFEKCTNLEKVQIKGSIDKIDGNAFYQCEKLSTIDLSKVRQIGASAFAACKSLKDIDLSSAQIIGGYAFRRTKIEKVELNFASEDSSIGHSAFAGCEDLKEVSIKGNLLRIEDDLFYQCNSLANIQIENIDKVIYIGGRAFDGTPWLLEQLKKSKNKMLILNHILVKYQPNLFYAGEYGGIAYGDLPFEEGYSNMVDSKFTYTAPTNIEMETVTIPAEVAQIAPKAFYGAYSVKNIIFDQQIKNIEIGEAAFDFTTWEKEYLEKENFLIIGGNLVKAKCNAEVIEVPNKVKKVIDGAFMYDCIRGKLPSEELVQTKEIILPQSVEEVGILFWPNWQIEKIIAPTAVTSRFVNNTKVEFKNIDTTVEAKDVLNETETVETPSPTAVVTETPSPTVAVTESPSPTAVVTESPSPIAVVTESPSPIAVVTETPSPIAVVTESPSPIAVVTETPSPIVVVTETPSPTAVVTESPSPTSTPEVVISVKKAVVRKVQRISTTKIKIFMKKTEKVAGYQILAATDKNFKKNRKKVNTNNLNVVLKNLKKGKAYYIKVRAYKINSAKKKVYGNYSNIKKIK